MSDHKSDDFKIKYDVLKYRKEEGHLQFFYGVRTTGIFCKPGCASRLAKPENVEFFNTAEEALNKGYRPCKKCRPVDKPLNRKAVLVSEICRIIEESEFEPSLQLLAEKTSYSESSVQKIFKQTTGISPKEYAKTMKAKRLKKNLNGDSSITSAIYSSGFGSSSRVYENANKMLGMSPSQYKKSGSGIRIRMDIFPCSLGYVLIAFTEKGVCSVELDDSREKLVSVFNTTFENAEIVSMNADDKITVEQILNKIQHPSQLLEIALDIDIRGTVFQRKVWKELMNIPPGETRSYSDIAVRIGEEKSVRAVANACASNGIALLIPCHRVVRKNGGLGGYKWGLERKKKLLQREQN